MHISIKFINVLKYTQLNREYPLPSVQNRFPSLPVLDNGLLKLLQTGTDPAGLINVQPPFLLNSPWDLTLILDDLVLARSLPSIPRNIPSGLILVSSKEVAILLVEPGGAPDGPSPGNGQAITQPHRQEPAGPCSWTAGEGTQSGICPKYGRRK